MFSEILSSLSDLLDQQEEKPSRSATAVEWEVRRRLEGQGYTFGTKEFDLAFTTEMEHLPIVQDILPNVYSAASGVARAARSGGGFGWLGLALATAPVTVPLVVMGVSKLAMMVKGWLNDEDDVIRDKRKRKVALENIDKTLAVVKKQDLGKLEKVFPKRAAATRKAIASMTAARERLASARD